MRTFRATADMSTYLTYEFELTDVEYDAAIKEHGNMETYASETLDAGSFVAEVNGGQWEYAEVVETTMGTKHDN